MDAEMTAPMLIPFLGVITGITAGMAGAPIWISIILIIISLSIHLLISLRSKNPMVGVTLNKYHHIWIYLLFAAVGVFSYTLQKPYNPDGAERYVAAVGIVRDISQTTSGDKAFVEVSQLVDSAGQQYNTPNFSIILHCEALKAKIDDNIVFPVRLTMIRDPENFFSEGYAQRMNSRGYYYETRVEEDPIRIVGHATTFTGIAAHIRYAIESEIENSSLDKKTQHFFITILMGDRQYLDRGVRRLFADAGVSHILALSGMHVAIISGILLWLLFPMNFFGYYRQRILIATIILYFYAFITGWQPSTVRATIMMTAMMICLFLERKNSGWNSLLFATIIILIFSPLAIQDVGLHLSFACVASLIFFVTPLNPIDHHFHPRLYKACSAILTTFAATFGTWCLSAHYFGMVPVTFLAANIVILPILPIYLVVGIIYFLLQGIGIDPGWMVGMIDTAYLWMVEFVSWVTGGGSSAIVYTPSALSLISWIIFAVIAAIVVNRHIGRIVKSLMGAALLVFVVSFVIDMGRVTTEAFIIQHKQGGVAISYRRELCDTIIEMPSACISSCRLAGKEIVVTDTPSPATDSIKRRCDILVIAGGNRATLPEIVKEIEPKIVVIHTSVRRARESRLLHEADSLRLPIYSIREKGAYRYPQPK
ncbi:MAG: ComEC/Rec2 family competence protein [Lepagella sp.]